MLGGKRAVADGQRVSPSRGDLQREPTISSISCSSSLAFHHQKYFGGVTQPAAAASYSNTRQAALSVPLARDLGRGEPQGSGLRTRQARGGSGGGDANPPIANARTTARARYWFFPAAAMTSGTGVRSASSLAS